MKMKKLIYSVGQVLGIAISVFLISFVLFAWDGTTANPPEGNIDAPLSAGSETQHKEGSLTIGGDFEVNQTMNVPDNLIIL
jgi:hypothetical protein